MRYLRGRQGWLLVNVLLLAVLVVTMWPGPASAQNAASPARARGEYTLVAGRTGSGGADAVYILDAANQEMVALRWETAKQSLVGIGYRDLSADAKIVPGR